uniref:(northern house mosquito) hypothetical protein n=1 Tax=Culex pipiens TaxID=7175 RepID=A0A8D8AE83_CULPI
MVQRPMVSLPPRRPMAGGHHAKPARTDRGAASLPSAPGSRCHAQRRMGSLLAVGSSLAHARSRASVCWEPATQVEEGAATERTIATGRISGGGEHDLALGAKRCVSRRGCNTRRSTC